MNLVVLSSCCTFRFSTLHDRSWSAVMACFWSSRGSRVRASVLSSDTAAPRSSSTRGSMVAAMPLLLPLCAVAKTQLMLPQGRRVDLG